MTNETNAAADVEATDNGELSDVTESVTSAPDRSTVDAETGATSASEKPDASASELSGTASDQPDASASEQSSTASEKPDASASEQSDTERARRKAREGFVVSNSMDKTVVVAVIERVRHPKYNKFINQTKRLYAHDEANDVNVGDRVRVMETRPMSKSKRWRVTDVLERAK